MTRSEATGREGSAAGWTSLHTPGPVNCHPRVLEALSRPLIHHRTAAFREVVVGVQAKLQKVFATEEPVVIVASSGTGAMEAAVANLASPGDRVGVVRSGKFGERWGELAAAYGLEVHLLDVPWGRSADPADLARLLDATPLEVVFLTHCETSTGALHPIRELAAAARSRGALTVVDAISGLLAHPLPMDEWGIDVVVGGSQKAFMLPPGLAFLGVSRRARPAIERSRSSRYYFDLRPALEKWASGDFPYTPAIGLIQGLDASLDLLLEEGLEPVVARYRRLAERARSGVRELGLKIFPERPADSLTVVEVPGGIDAKSVLDRIEREDGIRLAGGQGKLKGRLWRLGHMGDYGEEDLEAALRALSRCLR